MNTELMAKIESLEAQMTETLGEMISYPAISPLDGGVGEYHKVQYILKKVKELGFTDVKVLSSPDPQAAGGVRPNVIVRMPGRSSKRLWIVAHTDVVPEGERSMWHTDPFKAVVKDGRIYGRGVSDNGEEVISSLYALDAIKELGLTPEYDVNLAFVADEELGSKHGIRFLLKEGIFKKDDLVVVPDMGSEDGDLIEVAEKSICWIEFTLTGKQSHASMPDMGINACRAANAFSYSLDNALHETFPERDNLFQPPYSTFEPTKRRANVPNINTAPGVEVFCFDCRVLPTVPLEDVLKVVDAEIKKAEEKYGVKITYTFPQYGQAPAPTPADAPVVTALLDAVKEVLPNIIPKSIGVGGGTCAAYFRKEGIPAAVWGQESDCAHMPNEYTKLEHLVSEAKVFATMMLGK